MRLRLSWLISFVLLTGLLWAQGGNSVTIRFAGAPTGPCSPIAYGINNATGALYDCLNGAWNLIGGASGSTTFDAIGSGTNSTATMTVGTGATLTFSGSGVVNASTLGGATFAAPGTIGGTTPAAGTFTTLTANTSLSYPAINAAGQGGFFGPGLVNGAAGAQTAQAFVQGNSANDLLLVRFHMVAPFKIQKGTLTVQTGVAAQTVTFCFYNAAGSTLLLDTGTFDAGTSSTFPKKTFTETTFQPGTYLYGWSASNASLTGVGVNIFTNTSLSNALINSNVANVGKAANAVSGGVCPATTGAITASGANWNVPVPWFED